ncbi:MAG: hypothetical protein WCY11_02840 [Novosphingobium sp.]
MTIRFAPARSHSSSAIARSLQGTIALEATNDNMPETTRTTFTTAAQRSLRPRDCTTQDDTPQHAGAHISKIAIPSEALRHFARHGLNAARNAAELARQFANAGNVVQCRHWLGLCAAFDRRLADKVASELGIHD